MILSGCGAFLSSKANGVPVHFDSFSCWTSLIVLFVMHSDLIYMWFIPVPGICFAYMMPTWLFGLKLNQKTISGRVSWWEIVAYNCVLEPVVNNCSFVYFKKYFLSVTGPWMHILVGRAFGHKIPRSATSSYQSWNCSFRSVGRESSLLHNLEHFGKNHIRHCMWKHSGKHSALFLMF